MKITHLKTFIAIIAMFMSLCGASIAQDERERQRRGADQRPPRGAPQGQDQAGTLFQALDRNRAGKLQQNEIDLAVVVLRRMDENEDGDVSQSEIKLPPRRPGNANQRRPGQPNPSQNREGDRPERPSFESFLKSVDKDGDGKISKEEAPERMKERFGEADSDSDGFIDKEEQQVMIEGFRRRSQQGQGRQPGQPNRNRPNSNRPDPDTGQGRTERPRRPPLESEE